ncbi:MAG: glycosyltransferase [Lachnospiraceae bacterium]|nr:glycosyltransferase [Lachnospiraceae bacterium]
MNPLISIIVPVFNGEKYLSSCVDSILNQSYENIEVILVDDGSEDRSPSICDEYAMNDKRVTVIHKRNGGVYSARREGTVIAKGEYIGFIDADDWIDREMYQYLIGIATKYNADMISSGIIDEDDTSSHVRVPRFEEGIYEGDILVNKVKEHLIDSSGYYEFCLMPYLCNKVFKTEKIKEYLLLDPSRMDRMNGVFPVWLALLNSDSLYVTHKAFLHYRHVENSMKRTVYWTLKKYVNTNLEYWKKQFVPFGADKQMLNYLKYFLLFREPWAFDKDDELLRLYGGIRKEDRVIIYGAGAAGTILMEYLRYMKCNIIAWIDTNFMAYQKEKSIISPESICDLEFDYVLVGVSRYSSAVQICDHIVRMGIDRNRIRMIDRMFLERFDIELFL